jgi:hypothetical protein
MHMLAAKRAFRCLLLLTAMTSASLSLYGQVRSSTNHANESVARIPFVGCQSDGQQGPVKAPSRQDRAMSVSKQAAQRLAYYKAETGVGVLAPRGWHCFGVYGSNGSSLYVSPDPINSVEVLSSSWRGFAGPVVQIAVEFGGTSGRFAVARTIARVFPAHKEFVDRVVAEGIEPASSFSYGPYPNDTIKNCGKNVVEFSTPAQADGLGTDSRLQKNNTPISGAAILLGEEPNLLRVWVRLTSEDSDLTQRIIRETEREAARLGN